MCGLFLLLVVYSADKALKFCIFVPKITLNQKTNKHNKRMALVEMLMPKMGESVMEGTILNWLKQPGDEIEEDESVLEVATDKVDTEIPAIHAGILQEILAPVGEVVQVGQAIAIIATDAETTDAPSTNGQVALETPAQTVAESVPNPLANGMSLITENQGVMTEQTNRFYSPLVLNIARKEQISMPELERLKGSGKEGRVTKNDILDYVQLKKQGKTPSITPQPTPVIPAPVAAKIETKPAVNQQVKPAVSYSGEADIIEMDRMRKVIAQRMVESKHIAPHVTSCVEADVTNIVNWRGKVVRNFREKEGVNLTYTTVFLMAVAKALRDFPMINSSLENDRIILKKDINIGLAVALPTDNLIVPVIRNADRLNLKGMAHTVQDLAKRARENKLRPDELQGGTYTVSNIGSFGNVLGTPIIMQPQSAILSLGTVQKKPAVIETEHGDLIGIRHLMFLSHSYDHRIIDGALGGKFVRKVADYLEQFDVNTTL